MSVDFNIPFQTPSVSSSCPSNALKPMRQVLLAVSGAISGQFVLVDRTTSATIVVVLQWMEEILHHLGTMTP